MPHVRKKEVVLHAYYHEDENFFKNIHKRSGTYLECATDTAASISPDSEMFAVTLDACSQGPVGRTILFANEAVLAGFFVKARVGERIGLEGFHILPAYRHRWFTELFWQLVFQELGTNIFTALYEKNLPAIKHLQDVGFKVVRHFALQDKNYVFLEHN